MKTAAVVCLAAVLGAVSIHAQTIAGSGGTLKAPTAIGQPITVQNVALSNGATAKFDCKVIGFMPSPYEWKWNCETGSMTIDAETFSVASGAMSLTCSGGGRAHASVCYHVMTAHLTDGGIVTVTSKGATNNARSTVVNFSASW